MQKIKININQMGLFKLRLLCVFHKCCNFHFVTNQINCFIIGLLEGIINNSILAQQVLI